MHFSGHGVLALERARAHSSNLDLFPVLSRALLGPGLG